MQKLLILLFIPLSLGCPREPSPYHSKVSRTPGDSGFKIKINENPDKYEPGKVYTRKYNYSLITKLIYNQIYVFKYIIWHN